MKMGLAFFQRLVTVFSMRQRATKKIIFGQRVLKGNILNGLSNRRSTDTKYGPGSTADVYFLFGPSISDGFLTDTWTADEVRPWSPDKTFSLSIIIVTLSPLQQRDLPTLDLVRFRPSKFDAYGISNNDYSGLLVWRQRNTLLN